MKDTIHLLQIIDDTHVPPGVWLVAVDVEALYSSIPHNKGISVVKSFLQERSTSQKSYSEFVVVLRVFIFHNNFFLAIPTTSRYREW